MPVFKYISIVMAGITQSVSDSSDCCNEKVLWPGCLGINRYQNLHQT